jgi:GAF domain-containing protein
VDERQDRQALHGLAPLLLTDQDPTSVLQRVLELVEQVMPDGAAVSLTVTPGQRSAAAASTREPAPFLEEAQYRSGSGPGLDCALGGEVVEITDTRAERRWPDFVPALLSHGVRSLLAVPVPATPFPAALNVYAPQAGAFTQEHRRAAAEFAPWAAVVVTSLHARQDALDQAENLQLAMQARATIEQAKGMLIERHKVTPEQAFRTLTELSMRTNRKLRDLAEQLVLTGDADPEVLSAPPSAAAGDRGDDGATNDGATNDGATTRRDAR